MHKQLILSVFSLSVLAVTGMAEETTHRFLACGATTYIMETDGRMSWKYPHSTRDGYVLEDGRILLTLSKSEDYPGGAVVEIGTDGKETLIWKGTQSEVNSTHPTADGNFVITEAGPSPRLLELNRDGKIVVEFALPANSPIIICKPGWRESYRMEPTWHLTFWTLQSSSMTRRVTS